MDHSQGVDALVKLLWIDIRSQWSTVAMLALSFCAAGCLTTEFPEFITEFTERFRKTFGPCAKFNSNSPKALTLRYFFSRNSKHANPPTRNPPTRNSFYSALLALRPSHAEGINALLLLLPKPETRQPETPTLRSLPFAPRIPQALTLRCFFSRNSKPANPKLLLCAPCPLPLACQRH